MFPAPVYGKSSRNERPSRRMVSGLASSNHFLASHGSVIKRAATLASDSDVSRSGPTEKPRGQRPRPASAPAPLRGSTSRPAGHLWASPFLRARKPKSSGRRRAGRWTQSPSGPERGGIVPERAHTPPGYTDKGQSKKHQLLNARTSRGTSACAPIRPQIGKANPKVPTAAAENDRPPRHVNSQGARPSAAIGAVALLRKYNGVLKRGPSPPRFLPSFIFGLVAFWCFRLSLLRVRRPWPGPCTRAGAGAGPQAAARTTPPPHFKGKTMKRLPTRAPKGTARPGAEDHATSQSPNNAARKKRGPPVIHGAEFHGLPNGAHNGRLKKFKSAGGNPPSAFDNCLRMVEGGSINPR
jgi:hypothetical protein